MGPTRFEEAAKQGSGARWNRLWLPAALGIVVTLCGRSDTVAAAPASAAAPAKKPSFVFILTDDLATNLLEFMPNVRAMQQDGTTFSNYFVSDSLCCPSRTTIFTGSFPHNTGVYKNNGDHGGYEAFLAHGNEPHTYAVALRGAGYRTAMLGKYLNGYLPVKDRPATGWSEWDVAGKGYAEFDYELNENGKVVRYGHSPQDYLTDVMSGLGKAFIQSSKAPFLIQLATFAPHFPYVPAPRDAQRFSDLKAPRSAAFDARPDANAPLWLKKIPPLSPLAIFQIDEGFRKRAQSVLAVDQMVGEIRALLAAAGDNNTYVVFSSDNGLHMGEYSLKPGKQTPFDTDIRVPLIVVGPGVAKGRVVDNIVQNTDLFPTFVELAGASASNSCDGHSLVALLRGETVANWRDAALIEHRGPGRDPTDPDAPVLHGGNPTSYEALRTADALYVEYASNETSYYDLKSDPFELKNIAPTLPAATRKLFHDTLQACKTCRGPQACWEAQHLKSGGKSP